MIAQSTMDITHESRLLGGMSPQKFMRKHWQKKPLLVRQAIPGGASIVSRSQMFDLAASEDVESRLVMLRDGVWSLRQGPLKRSAIPALKQPGWSLLVQGLDLHLPAARELLDSFRFVPDARLDDLMVSFATDGGGVGPHVDSYDVFLLQTQGRRRWRIAKLREPELVPDVPLKILANFEAQHEWLLEPGDMLYLPPGWAHDGVAEGECMTCSIGFRAAGRDEIARDVVQRMIDAADHDQAGALYRDAQQQATDAPARIPTALQSFTADAVARLIADSRSLACALGEVLSEPKPGVWFESVDAASACDGAGRSPLNLRLHRRTRMMYDEHHIFINGESFRAAGRDAKLMRQLADRREIEDSNVRALSAPARELLDDWIGAGWLERIRADMSLK
jgi:50S ribosomal protein L16 3-hydroxylase